MEKMEKKVAELVSALVEDESLFLVDVNIGGSHQKLVRVLMDGDKGVSIDQCASLSRALGQIFEEEDWFDTPYNLEVTSPGVGQPLKLPRQFKANVGRRMKLTLQDGIEATGLVEAVSDEVVEMLKEKKVKKKVTTENVTIPIAEIKEALVLVSFK